MEDKDKKNKNNLLQGSYIQTMIKKIIKTMMGGLSMRYWELIEAKPKKALKPLTPAQARKRAERDCHRQEQIKTITATAAERVADIKTTMGR
jgi:hypothetical protein